MKFFVKLAVIGIVYLLWEFFPGGVDLVLADWRHGNHHHHYRVQSYPIFVPVLVPVYRHPQPVYYPAPVYYPERPRVIIKERVVVVERPVVVVEREVATSSAPLPKTWDAQPQGQFLNQCTVDQLKRGNVPMGTKGNMKDPDSQRWCYYDLN